MKECYDLSSQGKTLERGDAVWLFNPQRKKLSRNWKCPYVVIKQINNDVFRIQLGPRTKPRVMGLKHPSKIWHYSQLSSCVTSIDTDKQQLVAETNNKLALNGSFS